MRLRIAVLAASLLAVGLGSSVRGAEDAVLAEMYGRGVHAYFDGRYEEAAETLSDAIAQGSKDPRVYYYRGLTFFRLGRLEEANSDFSLGAREEVKDVTLTTLSSRSLSRVQGGPRTLIEKARQTARKEHRAAQVASDKLRYEEWQSNEKRMLRTVPAEDVAKPAEEPKAEEPKAEEPKTEEPKAEEPAKPAEPAADPFGDKPAEKPAEPAKPAEDPFGGAAPEKPATPPAAPPAKDDPFGG
jgi:hypothetical protein